MRQYKVCFWLNVPSNHQTLFMEALNQDNRIDLQVRYFDKPSEDRLKMGWRDENSLHNYECYVENVDEGLKTLEDWKERIHITLGYSYPFNRKLIPLFIQNNIKWVHWSERYGIGLARRLKYNVLLFKLFRPAFLLTKRSYGELVNNYAFGCFSQGKLARKDFTDIGIKEEKIEDLYYTTSSVKASKILPDIMRNLPFKYKFLYVGRLNNRKGIDDLIIAFSKLSHAESWGLILVGNDESNGDFQRKVKQLGLEEKILFLGGVSTEDVASFYSACDVFVLPSKYDGWGAVINEAASMNLPIIASDQTGAAFHLIEQEKNGYIYTAGNSNKLKESMQHYVSNKKLLDSHAMNSKKLVEKFSPKENVERFISAIEKWQNRIQ